MADGELRGEEKDITFHITKNGRSYGLILYNSSELYPGGIISDNILQAV